MPVDCVEMEELFYRQTVRQAGRQTERSPADRKPDRKTDREKETGRNSLPFCRLSASGQTECEPIKH